MKLSFPYIEVECVLFGFRLVQVYLTLLYTSVSFWHPGLRIRPVDIQGQDNVSQHFTYQWSRTTDSPQRMNWLSLTDQSDYPEQHVRLFKLEKDSDLQFLMAMLDTSSAAGLLLVNRKNSYDIDRSYFPPGEQVQ